MLKTFLAAAAIPFLLSTAAAAQSPASEARALWKSNISNVNAAADELSEALYAYVRATIDVGRQRLSIVLDGRVIDQHRFLVP